jgi:hypothetical protein
MPDASERNCDVSSVRIQAYLLSLLARQLLLTKDGFQTRYPNAWLVWEPGEWAVPKAGVDVSVAETQLPGGKAPERPLGKDALCFALKAPGATALGIGRAPDNAIVINDLTVSRLHGRLLPSTEGWSLEALSQSKTTALDGRSLPVKSAVRLRTGSAILLGGITVTYLDAQAMRERVGRVSAELAR